MSKKSTPTYCLVIDCSVAHAAGGLDSKHPTGIMCRDFLQKVRGICHRMAWTSAIKAEWDRHKSKFATEWLLKMERLGKLRWLESMTHLSDDIKACKVESGIEAALLKDCHLVEAALDSDSRVASLDDTVRKHFSDISVTIEVLKPILWVNPTNESEASDAWLEDGAPNQPKRRLCKK
jgi:hypothetical protein